MTSATARMESPTLIPTSVSSGEGEDGKVVVAEANDSKKGNQSPQSVKILTSGSTTTTGSKSPPSIAKSPPSVKANDGAASSSPAVDVIDSALLAALRDPRERLGLLKLEQNLIDFLEKQPQDTYVDIGGPYNSTVISPTLGYIGQQPQHLQAMAQPQPDGTTAGRPQTTFQRCILHRICDRFNMTRENSYTTDAYGCYLIRVCKGPDSKKPSRRLLNVKESEYQIPRPSDNTSGNGAANPSHQLSSNFQQLQISSSSSTNPPAGIASIGSSNAKGSSKVRKMKIMKRSSSNVSNGSSGSNNSKSKNNVPNIKTRSSLSEKEKKYAEARARIFEQEEENESGNGEQPAGASSNNGVAATGVSVPTNDTRGLQGNYSNNNTSDINAGYPYSEWRGGYNYNNNYNSYNPNRQSSQPPSSSSTATGPATGNPRAPLHNTSTTSLNSMSSNNSGGKGNNSDGDQQQSNTRSKATYRNRQQEETDPDFRRGAGMQLQANPYTHAHTVVGYGATGGGRGSGNVYYPNMVAANGNNNRTSFGYAQQQQQQYQYHHQHHPQQHYNASQHQQAQYYPSNNPSGGRGYAHSSIQYQQQRRQHEQHYPALSSSTTRK